MPFAEYTADDQRFTWGESNPHPSIFPRPGQSVAHMVMAGFRVTVVDRE